jgi:ankyrin repeat protein
MTKSIIISDLQRFLRDPMMPQYNRHLIFFDSLKINAFAEHNIVLLEVMMLIKVAKYNQATILLQKFLLNNNRNNGAKIFLAQLLYNKKSLIKYKKIFNVITPPDNNNQIDFLVSALYYNLNSDFKKCIYYLEKFIDSLKLKTSILHLAVEYGMVGLVKYILKTHKLKIDCSDYLECTPLHWAAWSNKQQIIKLLINSGANIEEKDKLNETAFYLAAFNGQKEAIKCLLQFSADMEVRSISTNAAIHMASYFEYTDVIDIMLNYGIDINIQTDNRLNTALHVAAWHGKLKSAKYLLLRGANVNAKQVKGGIPLHRAALNGQVDMVDLLLKAGADINCLDKLNRSPIYCAQKNKHKEVEKLLKDNGAV